MIVRIAQYRFAKKACKDTIFFLFRQIIWCFYLIFGIFHQADMTYSHVFSCANLLTGLLQWEKFTNFADPKKTAEFA